MKKIFLMLLALSLALSCAACAQPEAQAPGTAAPATEAATTLPETTAAPATEPAAVPQAAAATISVDDLPVKVTSENGLVTLELPNQRWAELHSDEHTLLFSDGDCAITVDLYKNTDKLPTIPLSDETHQLIFTSTLSADEYLLFITGYAHEETDFSPLATAIGTMRIDRKIVPQAAQKTDTAPQYTIQERNNAAWVTASSLNVRSDSDTNAVAIAALPQGTKVTVIGEVLENGRYIGWSKIKMSNGTVGFVASQFLSASQPKAGPERTGKTMTLWSINGTAYTLYNYDDGSWKNCDGVTYWYSDNGCWVNSSGKALYDYDPSYVPPTPAKPTKTGSSMQLWNDTGDTFWVYEYTDYNWRQSDSGYEYWPDGFTTWACSNGKTYYDSDPNYVDELPEDVTPSDDWKEAFEIAIYQHDGVVVYWYTYLGDNIYEAYCEAPENSKINGIVYVNCVTGSWEWA